MAAPLNRQDLSLDLVDRIVGYIREHGLASGDRLPSARDLAEMFAVATPTLREALRRLQATGMIDIRHGSGIYVRRTHDRLLLSNPHLVTLAADRGPLILDLLDARLLVEPRLAELAAGRVSHDDIADLAHILDLADHQIAGQPDALNESNMSFHVRIAGLSGNAVLAEVMDSLIELRLSEQLVVQSLFDAREADHQAHLGILDALREHDAALARERMAAHLVTVRQVVRDRMRSGGLIE
jgi:GntR family transcriptional repressor for pyruvate dehydrogenase complex